MAIIVPDLEMPLNCLECIFKLPATELVVGKGGLYKKISHCRFAPKSIEDPWRDLQWMSENKEEYCPLVRYGASLTNDTADDIEEGIEFPTGTFTVGPFTCKCTAKYKDKVEVTISNAGSFSDYGILSILTQQYGQGILISNYSGDCRVVIPIENIIERGGLL